MMILKVFLDFAREEHQKRPNILKLPKTSENFRKLLWYFRILFPTFACFWAKRCRKFLLVSASLCKLMLVCAVLCRLVHDAPKSFPGFCKRGASKKAKYPKTSENFRKLLRYFRILFLLLPVFEQKGAESYCKFVLVCADLCRFVQKSAVRYC